MVGFGELAEEVADEPLSALIQVLEVGRKIGVDVSVEMPPLSSPPTSRTWMRAPRVTSATSSANSPKPAATSTGHRRIRSPSAAISPTPTPRSQVSPLGHASSGQILQVSALIFPPPRLGVAGPDPPGSLTSRNRLGECEGEHCRRMPPEHPGPCHGGRSLHSSRGCR